MSKHLQRDLEALEQRLLAQSSVVEDMIAKSCRALREHCSGLAAEVVRLERRVDEEEIHIEEDCLKILALHQPVAVDLRRTATILKINSDLERIADLAVNIAERSESIATHIDLTIPAALDRMAQLTIAMVREAIDAFVKLSVRMARDVCQRDEDVDQLNREAIEELQAAIRSRPELVEPCLHLFSASRHIERIGDHATNIAEDVIYLVQGEIARHQYETGTTA